MTIKTFSYIWLLFFGLLTSSLQSQSLTVQLDYQAWYEVPSKGSMDTVMVRIDKSGRYLYTESDILNTQLGDILSSKPKTEGLQDKYDLLLDAKTLIMYLQYREGNNTMYMEMNIADFIPSGEVDAINRDLKIVSELREEPMDIKGRTSAVYNMYPENDPFQAIRIGMDEALPVHNNTLIGTFFEIMMRVSESEGSLEWDIPQGLITYLSIEGMVLLKAIEVKEDKTEIIIEHQFTIKE